MTADRMTGDMEHFCANSVKSEEIVVICQASAS